MVKQDSMNVFLGCYIPNEMSVHLWDLDSDYYLHNRSSRPPTPHTNRILHQVNLVTARDEIDKEKEKSAPFPIDNVTSGIDIRNTAVAQEVLREKIAKRYFIKCGTNQQEDAVCVDTTALERESESAVGGFHKKISGRSSYSSSTVGKSQGEDQEKREVRPDGANLGPESGISSHP
jgi:hypothetical protein